MPNRYLDTSNSGTQSSLLNILLICLGISFVISAIVVLFILPFLLRTFPQMQTYYLKMLNFDNSQTNDALGSINTSKKRQRRKRTSTSQKPNLVRMRIKPTLNSTSKVTFKNRLTRAEEELGNSPDLPIVSINLDNFQQ